MVENYENQAQIKDLGKEDLSTVSDLCPITHGQQKISERNHIILFLILRLNPALFPGPVAVAVSMS